MGAPEFLSLSAADRYHGGREHRLELTDNHQQRELRIHLGGVDEAPGSVCLLLTRAQCEALADAAERLARRIAD